MSDTQEHLGVTVKPPLPDNHGDEDSSSASEGAEPFNPVEKSGHTHPAEVISDVPALNHGLVTSSGSVTLSTPSVEVEASSPEIITLIPESIALSGAVPLEDIQDKLEREGLVEKPTVLPSTTQTVTHSDLERREQGAREALSGDSSGEGLSVDHNEAGTNAAPPSNVKITLIPPQTLTINWKPEPSAPAPQESRSDQEYSAEPPVTQEEQEGATESTTTSSINNNSECKESDVIVVNLPHKNNKCKKFRFTLLCLSKNCCICT